MSLNQNLNKFSKIKQGKVAKKRLARLSFYSDSRAALLPYITCIFRIYFTFQLRFFSFFVFICLPRIYFWPTFIWHSAFGNASPAHASIIKLGPGLAKRHCKVTKSVVSAKSCKAAE